MMSPPQALRASAIHSIRPAAASRRTRRSTPGPNSGDGIAFAKGATRPAWSAASRSDRREHDSRPAVLLLAGPPFRPKAQSDEDVTSAILSLDGRLWEAYNTCDTAAFRQFFTEDVEFYHDKGGATLGAEPLTASMRSKLCAEGPRLRREPYCPGSTGSRYSSEASQNGWTGRLDS